MGPPNLQSFTEKDSNSKKTGMKVKWKGVEQKGSAVNLKKTTQRQNRHYICIKYYFIFSYYYKMKFIFTSRCYKIIIIFLLYIKFCNTN